MQSSTHFQKTISDYLNSRELSDPLFAVKRRQVNRPIEDICNYILNKVYESGCNGFADAEIFGMAIHAAEEAELEIKDIKDLSRASIVINHHVELTEEEKEEQHQLALKRFQDDEYRKFQQRNNKQKQTTKAHQSNEQQLSLFDF